MVIDRETGNIVKVRHCEASQIIIEHHTKESSSWLRLCLKAVVAPCEHRIAMRQSHGEQGPREPGRLATSL